MFNRRFCARRRFSSVLCGEHRDLIARVLSGSVKACIARQAIVPKVWLVKTARVRCSWITRNVGCLLPPSGVPEHRSYPWYLNPLFRMCFRVWLLIISVTVLDPTGGTTHEVVVFTRTLLI